MGITYYLIRINLHFIFIRKILIIGVDPERLVILNVLNNL